jgi:hypothetical protein
VTFLNAAKPVHLDDAAFAAYAAHIAKNPLDPYAFDLFISQRPQPAIEDVTPPLVPCWLGLGLRLLGERPFLWKLWFFPFNFLFLYSLHALLRRFARGTEGPIATLTALSAPFLPSFNLMLDIPALGLNLFSIVLFLRGDRQECRRWTVLAGAVAGLAMQTKYTAISAPLVMALYAVTRGCLPRALLAGLVAAGVFISWEGLIALRHGTTHILAIRSDSLLHHRMFLGSSLVPILGAVALPVGFLGLLALRSRLSTLLGAGAAAVAGFAVVSGGGWRRPLEEKVRDLSGWNLEEAVFLVFGLFVLAMVGMAILELSRLPRPRRPAPSRWFARSVNAFLSSWLSLEFVLYFSISPFPAVRRLLGFVLVATLILGRWASLRRRKRDTLAAFWTVAGASIALGLTFYAVDFLEARAQKVGAEQAARLIRQKDPGGRIWYVGHWGFQYYAERAGMVAAWAESNAFRSGDWIVIPESRIDAQPTPRGIRKVQELVIQDRVPLSTLPGYYFGELPLRRWDSSRLRLWIARFE